MKKYFLILLGIITLVFNIKTFADTVCAADLSSPQACRTSMDACAGDAGVAAMMGQITADAAKQYMLFANEAKVSSNSAGCKIEGQSASCWISKAGACAMKPDPTDRFFTMQKEALENEVNGLKTFISPAPYSSSTLTCSFPCAVADVQGSTCKNPPDISTWQCSFPQSQGH